MGNYRHGHSPKGKPSPTYSTWRSMLSRCGDPQHENYAHYGGRGIQVCDRWREDFLNFLADMGDRPTGMTLDRIDPDGNYERANCRWATSSEQAATRRQSGPRRRCEPGCTCGRHVITDEHKAKISAAKMGHEVTEESRAKMRAAKVGRTLTDEHKAKISGGLRDAWSSGRRGRDLEAL